MDLGAYGMIDDLKPLLKMNGIDDISRLRGLRLMSLEKPVVGEELDRIIKSQEKSYLERMFQYDVNYGWWCSNEKSDYKIAYYLKGDGTPRWDRIHGKLRKAVKFEIKKTKKRVLSQWEMWNKYCGRDDVLYIHTRTGGDNWYYFGCGRYLRTDWFLDRVTDCYDCTYCDIYAKIDPETVKILLEQDYEKKEDTDGETQDTEL